VIDRTVYGSEPVARVLAYEPLHRVVFSSDIGIDWRGRGGSGASEVEVRFVEESPERTRVELEHRRLERHGDGCGRMRDAVGIGGRLAAATSRLRGAHRADRP